jgi:GntR family transcriptional regulator, transcriptional repressor for pyruvate dehydrogenase complex
MGSHHSRLVAPVSPRQSNTEAITAQLIKLIVSEKWRSGDRLPSEPELARQFGTGRGAVREALKALVLVGLVVVKRGIGTYVAPRDNFLVRPMSAGLNPLADLPSLIESRELIEVELAGLAANRAAEVDIAEIDKCIDRMDQCIDNRDIGGFLSGDTEFHFAVARAAHNPLLNQFAILIRNSMQQWVSMSVTAVEIASEAQPFHRQIYNAIRNRKVSQARESMRRHLSKAGKLWLTAAEASERRR